MKRKLRNTKKIIPGKPNNIKWVNSDCQIKDYHSMTSDQINFIRYKNILTIWYTARFEQLNHLIPTTNLKLTDTGDIIITTVVQSKHYT